MASLIAEVFFEQLLIYTCEMGWTEHSSKQIIMDTPPFRLLEYSVPFFVVCVVVTVIYKWYTLHVIIPEFGELYLPPHQHICTGKSQQPAMRLVSWIVFEKVCLFLCVYLCIMFFLHAHEQNFISLCARIEGYKVLLKLLAGLRQYVLLWQQMYCKCLFFFFFFLWFFLVLFKHDKKIFFLAHFFVIFRKIY